MFRLLQSKFDRNLGSSAAEMHDDVIKYKYLPRYWQFVRGIHRSPTQRPVTRSFDVFFDLRLNKRLSKQWRGWWFETLSRPSCRHRNGLANVRVIRSVIKQPISRLRDFTTSCGGKMYVRLMNRGPGDGLSPAKEELSSIRHLGRNERTIYLNPNTTLLKISSESSGHFVRH